MTRSSDPRRDFAAMQERRRRAARLFAAGKRSQAEVARELHISRQSVSRWFEAWRQDKPDWIRGAGRAGRRPKLDGAQFKQVDEALRQGAQAHGFGTDLWTLPRVAAVIERATGVHYHPDHGASCKIPLFWRVGGQTRYFEAQRRLWMLDCRGLWMLGGRSTRRWRFLVTPRPCMVHLVGQIEGMRGGLSAGSVSGSDWRPARRYRT